MIGGNKKFVNTPEGRYIFDAESNEYEAADVETRNAEQKKSDFQDAVIEIPDKIDKLTGSIGRGNSGNNKNDDDKNDQGIISTLLDAFGVDDGIKSLLSSINSFLASELFIKNLIFFFNIASLKEVIILWFIDALAGFNE